MWKGLFFQNMMNNSWHQFDWFNDYIMMFIVYIIFMVGGILVNLSMSKWMFKEFVENSSLELLWTFFPIFILMNVGYYSMFILYSHETENKVNLSIKVTGHQWYWSYDYTDFENLEFDSYMTPLNELNKGDFRLLEVDNRLVVPYMSETRMIVSSADVLHSWTIPSMGTKVDANPGRLNMVSFNTKHLGLFYGQCSEICGANHSFMPICLEVSNFFLFKMWIFSF